MRRLWAWWKARRAPRPVRPVEGCQEPGCSEAATHELGEVFTEGPDEGSGMIASYCDDHAPPDAIRLR